VKEKGGKTKNEGEMKGKKVKSKQKRHISWQNGLVRRKYWDIIGRI
jgi:hypothetical protein